MKKLFIIIAAWLFAAQCLLAQSFSLGSEYGGGIIIYIEPGKTWGLIAAKVDVPKTDVTYAQAVDSCRNWVHEKKGDWYLPSEPELTYMLPYRNLLMLNGLYWTTTDFGPTSKVAKVIKNSIPVSNTEVPVANKIQSRAVRRFYFPLISTGIEPACLPATNNGISYVPGPAKVTYGSGTNIKNSSRRMNLTIGDMLVEQARDNNYDMNFGSLAGLLQAPDAPIVTASQGELLDRIQVSWQPNPLGPLPTEGYKLFRDSVFLGAFDNKVRNFNDFNVIAGRPYKYEVQGINLYGDGALGSALGFQVPNGVVTGFVQTSSNRPVVDAMVTLTPMQGFSAKFGPGDLAFAEDAVGFLKNATQWTLATWIQTDAASADANLLMFAGASWSLRPLLSSTTHEGVVLNVTGQTPLTIQFPDSTKNGWHHIAITHDGAQFRAYRDGVLVGLIQAPAGNGDTKTLSVAGEGSQWTGRLDELRIYDRQLDELDFTEVLEGTASSLTPGLKAYWKMDEELGTKSFDVIKRSRLIFCGPVFDKSRPPVHTAGKTNSDGYYRIESANYGTGTTFIATPGKNFYMHRALKFVRSQSDNDYAELPNFGLTDSTTLQTATLELRVNSAGPDGEQCLISKKWGSQEFRLSLSQNGINNDVKYTLGGTTKTLGTLGMGYQHLALTFKQVNGTVTVTAYKNGAAFGTSANITGQSGNWSDPTQPWLVGARLDGATRKDYFGGLIDEFAVYDTILPVATIEMNATKGRDPGGRHLRAYFNFDEGSGNQLNNSGSKLTGAGTSYGTEWSAFASIQETKPHEFSPKTRQVTLNPSITSVDLVDFVDLSTVSVTGYVRYANTDCFAEKIEILVNGTSANPKVFTDSTGRFVLDLDPGESARLTPKFEDHTFVPAFWDVKNISSPITGILFSDMTTRTLKVKVAGGTCELPIIKSGQPNPANNTICKVLVRSEDGCYEKDGQITDNEFFEFTNLPPQKLTVAVLQFSEPVIKKSFDNQGGYTVDLSEKNDTVKFIYFAPPKVVVDGLSGGCSVPVFDQGDKITLNIQLIETYYGGTCPVDTASFEIINDISGLTTDTVMGSGMLKYTFKAGLPNPVNPYTKNIQIIATTLEGNEVDTSMQAVVTGLFPKEKIFSTLILPKTPMFVLHDPPGDASYAYREKGEKTCTTTSYSLETVDGGSISAQIYLGPDFELAVAPFGLGENVPVETFNDLDINGEFSTQLINDSTLQTCVSFNERLATSDDELVVGDQGGDLFVGAGMNLIFGTAIEVTVTGCIPSHMEIAMLQPDKINTMFIYSEWDIRRVIIPHLEFLAGNPSVSQTERDSANNSKVYWNNILANNDKQKSAAKKLRNISFGAGGEYEYSETSEVASGSSSGSSNSDATTFTRVVGGTLMGLGLGFTTVIASSQTKGVTNEDGKESGITTGYVLKDNDPGDLFSVDVAMDDLNKTPVFRTQVGQSSCPWEPNTAHRDACELLLRDNYGSTAIDVPANEPAVFKFNLNNISSSRELRTYTFATDPATNPDGAVIKLNGAVLDHPIDYTIPFNEGIPITVTVERGPEKYEYDDLEIALFSACDDDRAGTLGIDVDPLLNSSIKISAHFIKPCSEVEISYPEQDWLLKEDPMMPGSNDAMTITLSGYDKTDPDLDVLRVQYRPQDLAWITIGEIEKVNLIDSYYNFTWQTDELVDGPYEIRALAVCSTGNAADQPGYSHVIKGRIERTPPQVIGVPEPSDRVLNVGDEISVTFNKNLDCSKIRQIDSPTSGYVLLRNTETNALIDFDLFCFENKLELVPKFGQNAFVENKILRLELYNIPDLIGNKLATYNWEFFVDRNELAWLTDKISMTKTERETKTVTAGIHNRGGSPVPFIITGAPSWVRVVPDKGTLVPNEIRPISFEVDSSLAFGNWSGSVTLHTETGGNAFFMGGDETLPISVRVVCDPPDWNLDAGIHPVTMNMVVSLNIQGTPSIDEEDIVAAFINDELRGRARLQYFPSVDKYLAHLTIFGKSAEVTEPINFQIWDASACLRYGTVAESFTFQPDNVIGTPVNPQVLHTNNLVLREIPLNNGWNWVSFNLAFPDPAPTPALASLKHPEDDLIKNQNDFAVYGGGWFGSLTTLGNTSMYQFRADQPDTLKMMGNVIDPMAVNIPLTTGWNWLGYLPNYPLSVGDALGSLSAVTGDLIKGQYGFSQYINGFGWIGNLKFMYPPLGYQLRLTNPGTLTYPPKPVQKPSHSSFLPAAALAEEREQSHWVVDPTRYEHSMTLIGMLANSGQNATLLDHEIGAFVGGELRGAAQALYIEPLDAYLFFLTTYANAQGEQLQFKLYDSATGQVSDLVSPQAGYFVGDLHQGSIESPVPFMLKTTGTHELPSAQSFEVQPNPFTNSALVTFGSTRDQDVQFTVTDVRGREMQRFRSSARQGLNTWNWQPDLSAGVYFLRLQTAEGTAVRKVVKE